MDDVVGIAAVFIGLPWLILHYVTKWKTAGSLTSTDENMLDDMYDLARRLADRVETMERIVKLDNPDWKPASRISDADTDMDYGSGRLNDRLADRVNDRITDRRN